MIHRNGQGMPEFAGLARKNSLSLSIALLDKPLYDGLVKGKTSANARGNTLTAFLGPAIQGFGKSVSKMPFFA